MPALVLFILVFVGVSTFFLFIHLLMGHYIRPSRPNAEKETIYECGEPAIGSAWIQFDLRYYVVALLFVVFDVEVAFLFPWAVVFGTMVKIRDDLGGSEASVRAQLVLYAEADYQAKWAKLAREKAHLEREFAQKGAENAPKALRNQLEQNFKQEEQRLQKEIEANEKKYEQERERLAKATDIGLRNELEQTIYRREISRGLPLIPGETKESQRITATAAQSWALIAFLDIFVFFSVLLVGFAYLWRRGDIDWVRSVTHSAVPEVPDLLVATPEEPELVAR